MSKDQIKFIEFNVETLDNLIETFEYFITTMEFFKMNETFPFNLIFKVFYDWYDRLKKTKTDVIK